MEGSSNSECGMGKSEKKDKLLSMDSMLMAERMVEGLTMGILDCGFGIFLRVIF